MGARLVVGLTLRASRREREGMIVESGIAGGRRHGSRWADELRRSAEPLMIAILKAQDAGQPFSRTRAQRQANAAVAVLGHIVPSGAVANPAVPIEVCTGQPKGAVRPELDIGASTESLASAFDIPGTLRVQGIGRAWFARYHAQRSDTRVLPDLRAMRAAPDLDAFDIEQRERI